MKEPKALSACMIINEKGLRTHVGMGTRSSEKLAILWAGRPLATDRNDGILTDILFYWKLEDVRLGVNEMKM